MPMFRSVIEVEGLKCGFDDQTNEVCFRGRWYPMDSAELAAAIASPEAQREIQWLRDNPKPDFVGNIMRRWESTGGQTEAGRA